MMHTIHDALAWARDTLADVPYSEPLDAPLLLGYVLGVERTYLYAHPEHRITPEQSARFHDLITRRANGTPIAYLTGTHPFYDLPHDLVVTPDVLIPRPETEHLIDAALSWAKHRTVHRIVDVGTGSGVIAVTLATKLPNAAVIAVDVSRAALEVACQNAARYDLSERICFVQGDLLAPLVGLRGCDLLVANLPYIPHADLAGLSVTDHEPRLALDGGPDGLDLVRRLLQQTPVVLAEESMVLLEIGAGQGTTVAALARNTLPDAQIDVLPDYAGHDRVVRIQQGG